MSKLGFITFDEKLEAAWGLHKIEKAVLEKEIAELRERLAEADECNRRVSDENEKLRADNEWLIYTANRLVEALRPFMSGLKGQYPSFTDELPILAGASADDLQFVLKIGNFRLAHYLVEEFDKKNYSKELPILMEYEEKLSRLRAELKNENERVARLFTQIEQLQKALDIAINASAAAIRGNGDD